MARIDVAVGKRVRQRRVELGRTQGELATAVAITEHILEEIEAGERRAGGSLLIALAETLNVSLTFFFEDD
jgi:transcriptional regulator with XRE-family HTH domain